jgi:hypothetical protein
VLSNLPEVHTLAAMGLLPVGFRKGLLCGSCVIHMKLHVCIGGQVVHQQLNKLRGVSPLGILQEYGVVWGARTCDALKPGVIKSQEKRYSRLSMSPSIYLCSSIYNIYVT